MRSAVRVPEASIRPDMRIGPNPISSDKAETVVPPTSSSLLPSCMHDCIFGYVNAAFAISLLLSLPVRVT